MTRERAREMLAEFVLGTLDESDSKAVQAWLTRDKKLAEEADRWASTLGTLSDPLTPEPPPPALRVRLLADVARDRFYPFAQQIAKFCDLSKERMREFLRWADDEARWEDAPFPGIRMIHFDHGAASLGEDTGLVRFPAGMVFPNHSHHGPELSYILEGELFDKGEVRYGPGEFMLKEEGDEHHFRVGSDQDLLMVIVHNGFDLTDG